MSDMLILVLIRNDKVRCMNLTPYLNDTKTENAWEESKHPRDNDGRFSKSGEELSQSTKKRGKIKRRRKVIQLPKAEYAAVQHAFMTDVTREERAKPVLVKPIGNYIYTAVLINDDGERDIVGKVKIDGIDKT